MLDVGAGASPSFRDVLPGSLRYVDVDIDSGHVHGTAEDLPLRDGIFDGAVSYAVIEHLTDPEGAIREVARVLKPGGLLLCGAPGVYPYHPHPGDYHRWTADGLARLVGRWLDVETVEPLGGPILALATLVGFYVELASWRRRAFRPLARLAALIVWVGSRLDRRARSMADGREKYGGMSIGYLVVARRRC